MVDHLQSRVTPWRQCASHVKVRGTLLKMDVLAGLHVVSREFTGGRVRFLTLSGKRGKRGRLTRKRGKLGKPVIMNYYNKAMFTFYWIVKRSIAESVPDRASVVHTRIAAFEAVSAPEQYCSAPLCC